MKTEKPMTEDFFDAAGRKRTFELSAYANGLFLEAAEVRHGERTGLRFVLPIKDVEPWGELRDKVRDRLSQRDLVRNERGELHELHRVIRGQIDDRDRDATGLPVLLVDDLEVAWEELGRMLMSYSGWGVRIEIRGAGEE